MPVLELIESAPCTRGRGGVAPLWVKTLLVLLLAWWPAGSSAAVEIGFASHESASTFPHAFITLSGTVDANGENVDANYGFTVRHLIGPSILFRPVEGQVVSEGPAYVGRARRHFSLVLSDEEYWRVKRVVERWRTLPQPSYDLDRRTCVTFVADVAASLGLGAALDRAMMRRPRAFLERVRADNQPIIAGRRRATAGPGASPMTGFVRH
ncbi:MAG: hypothetical protein ACXWUN_02755 [Allosphingosinicella sp.]